MEEHIESCTMSPAESCVTIGLLVKNRPVRGLMDSGAKRSVIDIGTLETLDKDIHIDPIKDIQLYDASDNKMDILGHCVLTLRIPKLNRTITQDFIVLNVKTYKTLLLGRDFFRKMGPVTIDVRQNRIKIYGKWIKGDTPKQRVRVRTRKSVKLCIGIESQCRNSF